MINPTLKWDGSEKQAKFGVRADWASIAATAARSGSLLGRARMWGSPYIIQYTHARARHRTVSGGSSCTVKASSSSFH
jgi:hypothetical protein